MIPIYFLLVASLPFLVFGVIALLSDGPMTGPRSRPTLPSTYDPAAYATNPDNRPGRCSTCGEDNDPEYDYCRECASKLDG